MPRQKGDTNLKNRNPFGVVQTKSVARPVVRISKEEVCRITITKINSRTCRLVKPDTAARNQLLRSQAELRRKREEERTLLVNLGFKL